MIYIGLKILVIHLISENKLTFFCPEIWLIRGKKNKNKLTVNLVTIYTHSI